VEICLLTTEICNESLQAFYKQGYRYHTKYDDFEHIPLGSFQHVGDNILSLIRSLANAPEVSNPKDNPGKIIFYDFFGLFMISYTQTVGHVVNYLMVLQSLAIFAFSVHTFKLGKLSFVHTFFNCILEKVKYIEYTYTECLEVALPNSYSSNSYHRSEPMLITN
jgi:hypothetical protein